MRHNDRPDGDTPRADRSEDQASDSAEGGGSSDLPPDPAPDLASAPDATQAEVIRFLSLAESYCERGPVEQVESHSAIVFLVGERAYKLKRAVRYPYLDFSTIEKRRAVCADELRLNRRTAPELYLELRAVRRRKDGALGFDEGEVLDWLVVMRRFPADDLLATMADRGALDPKMMRELADRIAAFHDEAEIRPSDGVSALHSVIDGNAASMKAFGPGILEPEACAALHDRSREMLDRLAPLLARRAREGHVRHGHGDLHLANICLWRNRPTMFDCLEFDAELATGDVLHDLAFLLMDLWHRDCRHEAALVFNRYLDRREEADGVAALPLFLSMRAAVRAHVVAAAAARLEEGEERAGFLAEARDYLAFACDSLEGSGARLVAIGGLSGTGKSTLAAGLASSLGDAPGARWLRSDVIRKRRHGVAPETKLPPEAYRAQASEAVYREVLSRAQAMLDQGRAVIVDAVFARAEERAALADLARRSGVPFTGLWLEAPPEILRDRVAARRDDASDADLAVLERQLGYDLGDLDGWHRVSARGTREEMRSRALAALGIGQGD